MLDMTKGSAGRVGALLAGLGAVGLVVGACQAGASGASDVPVRCEIRAMQEGGMTRLEGVVHADTAVSGTYRFKVASGGTDVSQSGAFSAGPGGQTTVGKVMLGGQGHEASLEIAAEGMRLDCEQPTTSL